MPLNEELSTTAISCGKTVVHPWLCDSMGHLTTRNYMAMFDDASYHLLYHVFGFAPGHTEWRGKGWTDVKQVIEYKAEIHTGAIVDITGYISRIGTKSVTVNYEMRNLGPNNLAATMESTIVFFDLTARRAISLTPEMREMAQIHLRNE